MFPVHPYLVSDLFYYRDPMAIDWYMDFVDPGYTPARDELICLYYFEPAAGISREEAAGRIASESLDGNMDDPVLPSPANERSPGNGL